MSPSKFCQMNHKAWLIDDFRAIKACLKIKALKVNSALLVWYFLLLLFYQVFEM